MSNILGWLFGSAEKTQQSERVAAKRDELDTALEEHKQATENAEQSVANTERINRALKATAAALELAADKKRDARR